MPSGRCAPGWSWPPRVGQARRSCRKCASQARVGIATGHRRGRRSDRRGRGARGGGGRRRCRTSRRGCRRWPSPGRVVISQATRRLVGGLFELADLGPAAPQGLRRAARRVAGRRRGPGRRALRGAPDCRSHAAGRARGGARPAAALLAAGARTARARSSCSRASPGSASRASCASCASGSSEEPHIRLLYQCSPHHTTSPLHPVIEQLERAAGFERDDPPEAQARQAGGAAGARHRPARRGGAADRGPARRADRRALSGARSDPAAPEAADAGSAGRPARGARGGAAGAAAPTRTCTGSTRPRRSCSAWRSSASSACRCWR